MSGSSEIGLSKNYGIIGFLVLTCLALCWSQPVAAGPGYIKLEQSQQSALLPAKPNPPELPRIQVLPKTYTRSEIITIITTTAKKHRLDPSFLLAIARTESNFNPQAISPRGAMGLMQLLPPTAESYQVTDPMNPQDNLEGAIRYLQHLIRLFKGDYEKVLAAYHCGETRVLRAKGIPDIASTRKYIEVAKKYYRHFSGGKDLTGKKIRILRDASGVLNLSNAD